MPTIRDVARASGVSPATVSYVLNNGPKQVKPHTRDRVLRTMREMNYHPSAVARGLTRKRMNAIGVVFPNEYPSFVANPYVGQLLDGILFKAARLHQNVTLFTGQILSDTHHNLSIYCDGRCDGMLLISPPEGSDIMSTLLAREVPFVLIGTNIKNPAVSSIDVDNVEAARELVTYLIQQGHRRIAYLAGDSSIQSAFLRYEGYRQALQRAGIPYSVELAPEGLYWGGSGCQRTVLLMDLPSEKRPTALFCGSDEIALGALQALKELGKRVPDDVSVVGFDDISAAATTDPPLTTVRQPLYAMGERAAETLFEQITDCHRPGHKILFPTELILRSSAASAREF